MPLRERRPQTLSLNISLSNNVRLDSLHTPAPHSPFFSNQQSSLVMTPDTPTFTFPPLDGAFRKSPGAVSVSDMGDCLDDEWTEEEDEIIGSYLARPAGSGAYPPGTLPPPELLDQLTTTIVTRLTRTSSMSSLSSASSSSTSTEIDIDLEDSTSCSRPAKWNHSWAATRARLFRIARLESREALGGHTRNNSESIVPVTKEKLQRPKLVVLGSSGMSRQQHSMDNLFGETEQTIDQAVKLSGMLQGQAMGPAASVLHSNGGLSSPVSFEFGLLEPSASSFSSALPLVPVRPPLSRKPASAYPAAKSLPRPSLLQRGRSYTGADLARESGHSRDNSLSSEEFAIDIDPDASQDLLIIPPSRNMHRSASSPTAFTFPTSPAASMSSQAISEDVEPEPITPLNQTHFPRSALGLGMRELGSADDDDDADSTPGSTPAITLTTTSPMSASSSKGSSTPRCSGEMLVDDSHSPNATATQLAELHISLAAETNPRPAPHVLRKATGSVSRMTRPPPLSRSMSDISGFANPAALSNSTSFPANLNAFGPKAFTFASSAVASTSAHGSVSAPMSAASSSEGVAVRENKRQRGFGAGRGDGPVSRPRLNPGLTVMVPHAATGSGLSLGGGLRSPFEHKAPSSGSSSASTPTGSA